MSALADDVLVRYSGDCPSCGDEVVMWADTERETLLCTCFTRVPVSAERANDQRN